MTLNQDAQPTGRGEPVGQDPLTALDNADFSGAYRELANVHAKRPQEQQQRPPVDRQSLINRHKNIPYCSRSEQVCGMLLERYVPGFSVRPGKTFQVPIGTKNGSPQTADFLIGNAVFEFHSVVDWCSKKRHGDFADHAEGRKYRTLMRKLSSLEEDLKPFAKELAHAKLQQNYYDERRSFLNKNPQFVSKELVVATTPEEFYDRIIVRFGQNFPRDKQSFIEEFDALRELIKPREQKK